MLNESIARQALDLCLEAGAQKARVTLSHCLEDLVSTLNAEVDRVTHCDDMSLTINLFVDGRFGVFSTNKMDSVSLRDFIYSAVDIARTLAPDEYRDLPDIGLCCKEALKGDELGLVDNNREIISPEKRIELALEAARFNDFPECISEEGEYSDSIYETILLDSNGLECRHYETSFDYGVETTVEVDGEKYSSYWWDSSSSLGTVDFSKCGNKAFERALAQKDAAPIASGKYNMVLDSEVASKVVSPILRALNGGAIQQNNSFLMDSIGKKIFPEGMSVVDMPHIKGETNSKLFDSEGLATRDAVIIENGVVKQYFINSYYSKKLGMETTIESPTRAVVLPYPRKGLVLDDILEICGSGIYVTDFNGGNSNSVTGDFSYGVSGFYFADGKIVKPISEMLITGNLIELWNKLIACGEDARRCMSKLIPTLAFSNVDFSG